MRGTVGGAEERDDLRSGSIVVELMVVGATMTFGLKGEFVIITVAASRMTYPDLSPLMVWLSYN